MSEFNLKYIQQRREQLGISRRNMAELLGFSNSSVYWKYETGDYKFRAEILPKLAEALKCDAKNFFTQAISETEHNIKN